VLLFGFYQVSGVNVMKIKTERSMISTFGF